VRQEAVAWARKKEVDLSGDKDEILHLIQKYANWPLLSIHNSPESRIRAMADGDTAISMISCRHASAKP